MAAKKEDTARLYDVDEIGAAEKVYVHEGIKSYMGWQDGKQVTFEAYIEAKESFLYGTRIPRKRG